MTIEEMVANLHSDGEYQRFIVESSGLFVLGLITEEELKARVDAVTAQIEKQ